MRMVLGGTFDPLHKGHKALFIKAFELAKADKIIIGLTSDAMANSERAREVTPYNERKMILEEYLKTETDKYPGTEIEIIQIDEVFNRSITQEIDADAFVISEGRKHIAEETNEHRIKFGKAPLEVIAIPFILAQDGLPIKATRIRNGEIDTEGNLIGTVSVVVGTNNDIKLKAVRNIFKRVFSEIEFIKVSVSSGVPDQPWGSETMTGAITRATKAKNQVPGAHFGVGIEAGLFKDDKLGEVYDVQYCAILDRGGRVTVGHGPGFYYPQKVLDGLTKGMTVGQVMADITDIKDIGHKQGAIGYLTKNLLTREGLTEQAVIMALVPRLTELYD